jgi:hypothetical protein
MKIKRRVTMIRKRERINKKWDNDKKEKDV